MPAGWGWIIRGEGRFRILPVTKAEGAFDLVDGGPFAEETDISVESGAMAAVDEVGVDEDESLLDVKADGNDVHSILYGEFVAVFEGEFLAVEEFLVVCEHDDEGDVEYVLKKSAGVRSVIWEEECTPILTW